jgi:hypothetical protein
MLWGALLGVGRSCGVVHGVARSPPTRRSRYAGALAVGPPVALPDCVARNRGWCVPGRRRLHPLVRSVRGCWRFVPGLGGGAPALLGARRAQRAFCSRLPPSCASTWAGGGGPPLSFVFFVSLSLSLSLSLFLERSIDRCTNPTLVSLPIGCLRTLLVLCSSAFNLVGRRLAAPYDRAAPWTGLAGRRQHHPDHHRGRAPGGVFDCPYHVCTGGGSCARQGMRVWERPRLRLPGC